MVITSALHAEGPQFDPGWKQLINFNPCMELHSLFYFAIIANIWTDVLLCKMCNCYERNNESINRVISVGGKS